MTSWLGDWMISKVEMDSVWKVDSEVWQDSVK